MADLPWWQGTKTVKGAWTSLVVFFIIAVVFISLYSSEKHANASSIQVTLALQFSNSSKIVNNFEDLQFMDTLFSQQKFPKELQLIYRGSQHGWAVSQFHSAVDNKGPVFAIIKVKETKRICGGYNSIGYGSSVPINNFLSSADGIMPDVFESFLFSINAKKQYFYENNYKESTGYYLNSYANIPRLGWD